MPIFTPFERLGTLLSARYRIDRVLAVGGMGVVFAGHDTVASRPVAVKVLKTHDSLEPTRGGRFLQEARLMAGLRHPHVAEILDFGEDEYGAPYLVMELLEGETLESLLARRGTLAPDHALELLLPVLGALARVHDAGVVHRDVKPDNVFLALGAAGETIPKLLDFGIAKVTDSAIDTREGAVVGTPEYMAPEQLRGHTPTPATDVWAVAALFYRCATGQPPYGRAHPGEILARLSHEAPPRLHAATFPAGFRAAIDRALSRDASLRYASTREFAAALVLTAREGGVRVPHATVANAGLEDLDWAAKPLGARTLSSASLVRPRTAGPWAFAAVAFSSLVLGWAAVRHAGAQSAGGSPSPVEAKAVPPPPASDGPTAEPSVVVATQAPPASSASGPSDSPNPAPQEARRTERRRARAGRPGAPSSSPSPAAPVAPPAPRDDLPVVTEW